MDVHFPMTIEQASTPHEQCVVILKKVVKDAVLRIDAEAVAADTMANLGWGDGDPVQIAVSRMREEVLNAIESA